MDLTAPDLVVPVVVSVGVVVAAALLLLVALLPGEELDSPLEPVRCEEEDHSEKGLGFHPLVVGMSVDPPGQVDRATAHLTPLDEKEAP
jgi:hypothetical protein